ncbi:nitrate ABC transporter permease [Methyloraptor flagellatus]|uniref:Nitrate ABC transporter permease n=1 Tax=Methyloraptor flagellatus TaxID=3162530 RepID=A0AAU7X6E2_9HYPH
MAVEAETMPEPRRSRFTLPSRDAVLGGLARGAIETARVVIPPLVTLAVLLAIWQIAFSAKGSPLPTPWKVVTDTWGLIIDPFFDRGGLDKGLALHILASLKRVAIGFSISAVTGILLGVLIGSSSLAFRGLDPIFQVLRTVPPLAWLPIALAAFREAQPAAIFVIAITAVWPIMMNTAVGIRNLPQDYRNVARVLQLNGFEYFFKIVLPATVPYIFTGLKIGIGLSWLAIVAAEMLVGGVGIGFFLWDSWNSSLISEIILALVYIGLVGLLLDRLITYLGRLVGGPGTF